MTVGSSIQGNSRKPLALLIAFLLALGGVPGVFAQASTAAISGVILDPSGRPAEGFRVTLRDVSSNTQYTSGATDAEGNYTAEVPVGGRYMIDNVVAADGVTKLPVQDIAPVSVLAAGTTRLNVRFTEAGTATTRNAGATPAPTEDEKKKKKPGTPLYQRPGPIVGMVLGAAAIAAIVLIGGGSSNNNASPSQPTK